MKYYICVEENCRSCHSLKFKINEHLKKHPELANDIEYVSEDYEFFRKHTIMSFPTIVLIDSKTNEEVDRLYGDKEMKYLEKFIN